MKKRVIAGVLALLLAVMALLCGCSAATKPVGEDIKGEITVYYLYSSKLYKDTILRYKAKFPDVKVNAKEFYSSEDMAERIEADALAGTLPDVLLFDTNALNDTLLMASQGHFLDIGNYFGKHDDGEFIGGTIEACSPFGAMHFMPFSVSYLRLLTSEEILAETETVVPENITFESIFEMLNDAAVRLEDEEEMMVQVFHGRIYTVANLYYQASGRILDGYAPAFDFDLARRILDIMKKPMYTDYNAKVENVSGKPGNARELGLDWYYNHIIFFFRGNPMHLDARLFSSIMKAIGKKSMYIDIPKYDDPEKYSAHVIEYGAVAANSANPEAAYMLLKTISEYNEHSMNYVYNAGNLGGFIELPARYSIAEAQIAGVTEFAGGRLEPVFGANAMIEPLEQEYADRMLELIDNTDSAYITTRSGFWDSAVSYLFDNGEDLDTAMANMQAEYELYFEQYKIPEGLE